jgi:hypothetical protein
MIRQVASPLVRVSRKLVLKANYLLNNYREVVWLLGDGRSGTTWVSSLVNFDRKYREMFEPFHPMAVRRMRFLVPHQYVRPQDPYKKLYRVASSVFSGKFTHRRVDAGNRSLAYDGLLIKDIFANLFCYWAAIHFPEVKPVLLIRNPFSVALSKYKKPKGSWMTNPLDLLHQAKLYEDYLFEFEDLIQTVSRKNDYVLSQVLIWSIINYVPLRQFKPGGIHICFYEDIYRDPNTEIYKIFDFIGGSRKNQQFIVPEEVIKRPSRVAGAESNLISGTSPVSAWKDELSPQTIDAGLEILQHFGFDDLYDDESMPNARVLTGLQPLS